MPARFISTRMYVREQFLRSHEMARKKAQIRRPDLFPRGCMSENNFWDRTKWHEKRPKYAGPIYFHADVWANTPARFIFTRMHVREQFLRSHEMARKNAQICRPDLFSRGCMSENKFWDRTKWHEKRPKYAGPIYFHADVCRKEFLWPFLLTSLLRSRGSLRLPRSLRAWINVHISQNCFCIMYLHCQYQPSLPHSLKYFLAIPALSFCIH